MTSTNTLQLTQVYGIRTRSRAVEIFTTCANLICAIEELEKVSHSSELICFVIWNKFTETNTVCVCVRVQGAAKALIFPVVQQFTEAFVQALQMPDGPTSDSGLKMEVLKVRGTFFIFIKADTFTSCWCVKKHCFINLMTSLSTY